MPISLMKVMVSCRSSRFLPETRSSSPWMASWTRIFRAFHCLDNLPAEVAVDALTDGHLLADAVAGGLLGRLEHERTAVHIPAREIGVDEIMDLSKLQVVVGGYGERAVRAVDASLGALEVKTLLGLAFHAVDGVVHFREVNLGYDIERWHVLFLRLLFCCAAPGWGSLPHTAS